LAYTVITLIAIPVAPVVGNLLKKVDARWIITVGVVLAALANLLLSMARSSTMIYVAGGVQGVAITLATTIPISTMITNWFTDKRGTALGVATAGSGLGSLIFVPLISFVLLPGLGWRGTYLALAAIQVVLLVPLSFAVLRSTPEQKGLLPLGQQPDPMPVIKSNIPSAAPVQAVEIAPRPGMTQAQVYRTPAFWVLGAALIFSGVSVNGMVSNLQPILVSLRSPASVIAFILASLGLWVMLGKFLTGLLFDKAKLMVAIGLVSLANAAQFFFMLSPTTMASGSAFAFLHGFGATMVTVTPAYLAVYASVSIFAMLGAALAPLFGGFFYGTATTTTQGHAHTLVWAWLIVGLVGFALYVVTVVIKPTLPQPDRVEQLAQQS
jgi:MFS family permease